MQAEIITIGDELLIGQVVDTNSAWLGQILNKNNIRIKRINSISDDAEEIKTMISDCLKRSELIIITGGLGPTKDDITKKTLAEYFNMGWRTDEKVMEQLESFFKSRGRTMLEVNKLQADLPDGCTTLFNEWGTAPGMWFDVDGKVIISVPGVPYEMIGMMEDEVLDKIAHHFQRPSIVHRTVLTQGVGESFLADVIQDWENSLDSENIKLAYLPSPGMVKLRMSAYGGGNEDALLEKIARKEKELLAIIGEHVFGFGKDTLASVVGKMLLDRKETLCVAESCTGGFLSHLLTSTAGASDYFVGGVIAYTYSIKDHQLGVSMELLQSTGAVNEETAIQMAEGARQRLNTTYAISTTGIAGPGGGTPDNPVGTIWIAVATPEQTIAKKFSFGKNRERNILVAANSALNLLRKEIIHKNV
jgi:nicotinamide-nucleotide amidase